MASFLYWAAIGALTASVESLVLPAHVSPKSVAPVFALANFGGHRIPVSVGRSLSTRTKRWASSISTETFQVDEIPPLTLSPPMKVGLIVEPTPFTHVRFVDREIIAGFSFEFKTLWFQTADTRIGTRNYSDILPRLAIL